MNGLGMCTKEQGKLLVVRNAGREAITPYGWQTRQSPTVGPSSVSLQPRSVLGKDHRTVD